MGYVIVGAVCLIIGSCAGILAMGLCVASKNNDMSIESVDLKAEKEEVE